MEKCSGFKSEFYIGESEFKVDMFYPVSCLSCMVFKPITNQRNRVWVALFSENKVWYDSRSNKT